MLLTNCYDGSGNLITYLTQWDINQTITIDIGSNDLIVAPTVHFANIYDDEAEEVQGTLDGNFVSVEVPNSLLQEPYTIKAYVYISDPNDNTSQKTLAAITIPVRKREMPASYTTNAVTATSVALDITSLSLSIGDTQQLVATVTPYNTTKSLAWKTTDSEVATVDDGLITAIGEGTCNISATCGSVSKTCIVVVTS